MAHQQHRAAVLLQRRLEQLERIDVEVVGGLVEHQHVRRPREQPREQQAVALASGEHLHRRIHALRREQEVAEVAHDVLALRPDLHPVGTRADRFRHAALEVELLAHLVEVGDLEVRAVAHGAGIRRELAEDELQQRGLAGAVRSDEADAVAAHQPQRQVGDDPALAEALRDVLEFGDQLPGAFARVERQPHAAHAFPPRGALVAQLLEPAHPARIARAAGLHALADPDLLLCPELVEAPALERLRGELLLLASLVGGEVARERSAAGPGRVRRCGSRPCPGTRGRE